MDRDFTTGIILGAIIIMIVNIIFTIYIDLNRRDSIQKRCIEVKVGTYENGEFKYLDKNIEYIITGKK